MYNPKLQTDKNANVISALQMLDMSKNIPTFIQHNCDIFPSRLLFLEAAL